MAPALDVLLSCAVVASSTLAVHPCTLAQVQHLLEAESEGAEGRLREVLEAPPPPPPPPQVLEVLQGGCSTFLTLCSTPNTGLSMTGKTRLDKERLALCQQELVRGGGS